MESTLQMAVNVFLMGVLVGYLFGSEHHRQSDYTKGLGDTDG